MAEERRAQRSGGEWAAAEQRLGADVGTCWRSTSAFLPFARLCPLARSLSPGLSLHLSVEHTAAVRERREEGFCQSFLVVLV
eukprot:scaffold188756_cov37-Tisochrysis_lutea.AAC.3